MRTLGPGGGGRGAPPLLCPVRMGPGAPRRSCTCARGTRPPNPVEFLATYLLQNNPQGQKDGQ